MERQVDIEICERKDRSDEFLQVIQQDELQGSSTENDDNRRKKHFWRGLAAMWIISLGVVLFFTITTALADQKYASRVVADCFFKGNNGTIAIPGSGMGALVTTWGYAYEGRVYMTHQGGISSV